MSSEKAEQHAPDPEKIQFAVQYAVESLLEAEAFLNVSGHKSPVHWPKALVELEDRLLAGQHLSDAQVMLLITFARSNAGAVDNAKGSLVNFSTYAVDPVSVEV